MVHKNEAMPWAVSELHTVLQSRASMASALWGSVCCSHVRAVHGQVMESAICLWFADSIVSMPSLAHKLADPTMCYLCKL